MKTSQKLPDQILNEYVYLNAPPCYIFSVTSSDENNIEDIIIYCRDIILAQNLILSQSHETLNKKPYENSGDD